MMNQAYKTIIHPLKPLFDENSEILILGSFPSVKSREMDFFYMNKTNRFYDVMSNLFGFDFRNASKEEKIKKFKELHIALYDSIYQCDIIGSSDSSIKNVVPTDLESIIKKTKIKGIFVNGNKSFEVFSKYHKNLASIAYKLPSTSALNASFRLDDLLNEWNVIRKPLNPLSIGFDLDGTLLDSYDAISSGVDDTMKHFEYDCTFNDMYSFIKKNSVTEFLHKISSEKNIDYREIRRYYATVALNHINKITLMEGAEDILRFLFFKGIDLYVYTHREVETDLILSNLNIKKYFKDIINASFGLKRKPDKEGIEYILGKYHIEKEDFIYVGDRPLDIECAKNAGVRSIYFNKESMGIETYRVESLCDIKKIINKEC